MDSLRIFVDEAEKRKASPHRLVQAARSLINGALRIRTGNDGLYPVAMPVTKPAEAVSTWLKSMERDVVGGDFHRHNEMQEALIAAAEEVNEASLDVPQSGRLRDALYEDALGLIDEDSSSGWRNNSALPWIITAGLAGILIGILWSKRKK